MHLVILLMFQKTSLNSTQILLEHLLSLVVQIQSLILRSSSLESRLGPEFLKIIDLFIWPCRVLVAARGVFIVT